MKVYSNDLKRTGGNRSVATGGTFVRAITWTMLVLISSILVAGLSSTGYGVEDPLTPEERAWLMEHDGKIIVNSEAGWPPIIDTDKNGNSFGIVMDYQRLIEKKLNFKFKMDKLDSWKNFMERFRTGKIDVNNNLQKNPERTEYALFTKPYIDIPNVIIVRKEIKDALTLEKMREMKIAVTSGFAIHDYIKKNYDYLQLIQLDNDLKCLLETSTRNVDAAVVNLAVASFIIEKMGISNLRVAGYAEYTNALCFASRKDWPILNRILDKGLSLITQAERDAIYRKWISLEYTPFYKDRNFWIIVGSLTAVIITFILMVLVWNRSLRRQVELRTEKLETANAQLKNEIDERKRAEQALRESEDLFRSYIEEAPDGVYMYDMEGTFLYGNRKSEEMIGYRREELIGKNFLEANLLPENSLNKAVQLFQANLEGKSTGPDEIELMNKEGRLVPVEISTNVIQRMGQRIVLSFARDITERKQAEAELRQQSDAMDAAIDGMAILNEEGEYVYLNKAHIMVYGYERAEELIGKSWRVLYDSDSLQHFDQEIMPEFSRKGYWSGDVVGMKKDGTKFPQSVSLTAMAHGGLICVVRDITDRKRAEEHLQETFQNLRKSLGVTIQVMVSAIEVRDPYTAGHQIRVADLARAIATEMGLPQEKIEGIRMAGSIHDIGKLSIPAEILSKPTKLSDIEFSLIKEHARKGYEMLKDVESPWPLAEIVYQHHERMDGSGYPRNLKGDEILMEARIMAVADVVEAMASHRPYRAGLGIGAALEEIEKNRGVFYDESVVDACVKLFREKGFQLQET